MIYVLLFYIICHVSLKNNYVLVSLSVALYINYQKMLIQMPHQLSQITTLDNSSQAIMYAQAQI
jgi:hypothetical protein